MVAATPATLHCTTLHATVRHEVAVVAVLRPEDRFCYAEIFYAGGNVALSVVLCLAAVWLGFLAVAVFSGLALRPQPIVPANAPPGGPPPGGGYPPPGPGGYPPPA